MKMGLSLMLSLSVCIIAKNEETHIEKCLNSISPFVREIIVVDTGSTDATIEIANKYTPHVYEFEWINDFSIARNYAISKASQPTILVMDADEVLDPESIPHLDDYCSDLRDSAGRVQIINQNEDGNTSKAEIIRIIPNNNSMKYTGRIHEQVVLTNGSLPKVMSTEIRIFHFGYSKSVINNQNKIERNIELLLLELQMDPENPYILYQLGKTNYVGGKYEGANLQFQNAIDLLAGQENLPPYLPNLLISYAYSLLKVKDFDKLFSVVEIGVDLYPDFTDIYFIYGIALMELKDVKYINQIRESFEYCLKLGEADSSKYETVTGVGSFRALYNLGVYYEVLGELNKAIEYYKKAEKYDSFLPAFQRIRMLDRKDQK